MAQRARLPALGADVTDLMGPAIGDDVTSLMAPAMPRPRVATPPPEIATRGMRRPSTIDDVAPPVVETPPDRIGGTLRKATGITAAPPYGVTERLTRAGRSAKAGLLGAGSLIPGLAELTGDALGLPSVAEWGKSRGQAVQAEQERLRKPPPGSPIGTREDDVYSGIESIGLAAPTLAVGAVAGSEAIALGIFGGVTGSQSYRTAREKGLAPLQAFTYAAEQGLIEALTEKIPASRLINDILSNKTITAMLGRQLAAEIPGEQVATIAQDATDWAHLNPEQPFSAYLEERPTAAARTLVATVVGTLGQTGGVVAAQRIAQLVGKERLSAEPAPELGEDVTALMGQESPAAVVAPGQPTGLIRRAADAVKAAFTSRRVDVPPPPSTSILPDDIEARLETPPRPEEPFPTSGTKPAAEAIAPSPEAPSSAPIAPTRLQVEGGTPAERPSETPSSTTREPWQMTRAEFRAAENQPRYEAIQAAIKAGTPIVLTTQTQATRLARPEHIRITSRGEVQIPRGRQWDTLTDQQVEALAAQAGVKPVPFEEKVYHRSAVEEAVQAGRAVPAAVLAEYPEFADAAKQSVSTVHRNTIRRFDDKLWLRGEKRPSQGEMRDLRDAGLAVEHRDHTFTLTESGRAVLAEERQRVADADRVDTSKAEAQTTPDVSGEQGSGEETGQGGRSPLDRIAASVPPSSAESPTQAAARRAGHYRNVWRRVLTDAQTRDPLVDKARLRKEFDARVLFLEEMDDEFRASGHDPRALLEAIAAAGGISLDAERGGGMAGEIRWLRESAGGPYGNFAGVPNVFRARTTAYERQRGIQATGRSFDEMATLLRQDPRFAHIEGPDELNTALEDIARMGDVGARGAVFPGTDELATRAGMQPGEAWWENPWFPDAEPEPETLTAESYQRAFGGTKEQAEAVIAVYQAMGIPLDRVKVVKGGTPGAGTLEQVAPKSAAFRRWFGDSKVVDEQGNPLGVYHGTTKSFTRFNPKLRRGLTGALGFWFGSTPQSAEAFQTVRVPTEDRPVTMPVYLSIQNPAEYAGWGALVEAVQARTGESIEARAKSLRASLRRDGHDGIVVRGSTTDQGGERDDWVAFEPTQIKSAIGNRGTFDPTKANILEQRGDDLPRLTVLHNIHVDGLIHADKIGGLAVPSLGVVREGDAYSGMGNITLIGRPHLGDPRIEPIYDADVWSQTFPRPEYRKARSRDVQPVVDALKPFAQRFENGRRAVDILWDNAVNSADPQDTISSLLRSNAAKAWFLSTQGVSVEPVIRDVRLTFPWVQYLDWDAFRKAVPFNDERSMPEREQGHRAAVPLIREAIDRYLADTDEGRAAMGLARKAQRKAYIGNPQAEARWREATAFGVSGEWINDPDGQLPMSLDWKITDSHNNLGKREVDERETERRINEALKGRESEFKAWLEEKVLGLHPPPHVTVGKAKRPYTLHNIVDAMTGRVRAAQSHMTFGEGKARAAAAKKFTDLEQMRRWAASNIRPEEDIDEARETAKKAVGDWRDEVVKHYGGYHGDNEFGRVWEGLDASMRALARWARGRKDADAMLNALSREGFSRVPINVARDGVRAGMLWLKAPVPYFEAKPQRAVMLNEFAGAAIPDNAGPEVKAILDKHGIRYREYDTSGKDTDPEFQRAEAVRALEQELQGEGVQVLFQPAYHGSPHVFEKFSLHKIGTGEGALAYGWGLYFAGRKEVAEEYRQRLSNQTVEYDGVEYPAGTDRGQQLRLIAQYGQDEAIAQMEQHERFYARNDYAPERAALYRSGIKWMRTVDPSKIRFPRTGRVYKVEIPDDDQMLDWDKRLSEQSAFVQEALKEAGVEPKPWIPWEPYEITTDGEYPGTKVGHWIAVERNAKGVVEGWNGQPFVTREAAQRNADARNKQIDGRVRDRGQHIYQDIGGHGSTRREASEALNKLGIVGIRYLDQGSRGKGEGTYNYVIFDDSLIQITDVLQQGPKASVEFTGQGEAIVRALKKPDVSSGVHEAAHVARRFLFDRAIPQELREGITDEDIQTAEEWAGAKDGEWSRDAEEKFARGFERYLYEGEAPSSSLTRLFEKFAQWLGKIYQMLAGSPIDVEISPAMRQVFDRLITRSERLATAEATGDTSFDVEAFERDLDTLYQDDRPSRAKRGRPKNMVAFSPAISGPSGAKLYGYQWHWTTDLVEDKREGMVERRVSDWENAVPSETTGRDIVHEFLLERKDGSAASVSLETALRELGYLAQAEGSKQVRGIASTLKTLARARMDRDRLLPLKERHEADIAMARREVDGLTVPEPVITRKVLDQGGTVRFEVAVGDQHQMRFNRAATADDYRRTPDAKEHIADVVADWRGARVQERLTVPWASKERFALEAAEESIRKAEQRLAKAGVNLTEAPAAVDTLDTGEVQPRLPGAEAVREQEIQTPTLEAPFSLTAEASKAKKGKQETLFQGEPPKPSKWQRSVAMEDLARIAQRRRLSVDAVRRVAEQAGYAVVETGPRPARAETGREIPPQKPIPEARILEFPSIQKMPKEIRTDIQALLEKYHGFEAQRRGVQSWDRTTELAKEYWLPLETLRPGTAQNAEELRAFQLGIATTLAARAPILERIKAGTATDLDKAEAVRLTNAATVFVASYRGAKAEAGRALNILRVQARVLDLGESAFLERLLKTPGLGADAAKLSEEALAAAGDPLKQLYLLRRRAQGTIFDKIQAYYYANILSGPKTQERNILGNASAIVPNLILPIGAAPIDYLRSKRTGQPRSVYLGEIPHSVTGAAIGVHQGMRNGWFALMHGFRPTQVTAATEGIFDTPQPEFRGGLLNPWNVPFRGLLAADEFFRAIAKNQDLYARIYTQVRNEGVSGHKRIAARMTDILTSTDPAAADTKTFIDADAGAEASAARAVYQEQHGPITAALLKLKSPHAPWQVRAVMTLVATFIKTPSAILRQGLEWTPAGLIMRATPQGAVFADKINQAFGGAPVIQPETRAGAQALGRVALGSLAMLPMVWLASIGRLTGAPPEDEDEREEFYAQGKLANAIKLGPYWVRYLLFQPFSIPMAAVANAVNRYQQSEQDEAAAEEAFWSGIAGFGQALLDQTFMLGFSRFVDALQNPERYSGQWIGQVLQGFIPMSGLLRNVTQASDPVYRRPEGVLERGQAIIPGASDALRPRRTRFGAQATAQGPWWQRGFVVPEVSKEASDLLTRTLAEVGYRPTVPRPTLQLKGERVQLSREQQDVLMAALGQERKWRLERVVRGSSFETRSDEAKAAILEHAATDAGEAVRARALRAVVRREPLAFDRLVSPGTRDALKTDREAVLGPAGESQSVVAR